AQPFLQRMLLEEVPKIKTDTYEIRVYSGSSNGLISPLKNHTRSEEHTSELQSRENLVCRLLLEKQKPATPRHDRHASPPPRPRGVTPTSSALQPAFPLLRRSRRRRPPTPALFPYTTLFRSTLNLSYKECYWKRYPKLKPIHTKFVCIAEAVTD